MRTKCKSGLMGWKAHLQENYSDFNEFEHYNKVYGLSKRVGFNTAMELWEANPLIEGSVDPSDFRISLSNEWTIKEWMEDSGNFDSDLAVKILALGKFLGMLNGLEPGDIRPHNIGQNVLGFNGALFGVWPIDEDEENGEKDGRVSIEGQTFNIYYL